MILLNKIFHVKPPKKCQIYFSNAEKKIYEISLKKKRHSRVKYFQKYEIESLQN